MDRNQNFKSKTIILTKWFFSIIFILISMTCLFHGRFLASFSFFFMGLFLSPSLEKSSALRLHFMRTRRSKVIVMSMLIIAGAVGIHKMEDKQIGFDEEAAQNSITSYITSKKSLPLFRNMEILSESNSLFNQEFSESLDFRRDYFKFDEKSRTVTYQPFHFSALQSDNFLNPLPAGVMTDYQLLFLLDSFNRVTSVTAIASFDSGNQIWKEDDTTDLSRFLLSDNINLQKQSLHDKQSAALRQKEEKGKDDKFEEDCMSSWDGSCPALKDYVKSNLNDTDGFEEIETTFRDMGSYEFVRMTYRAKNLYGAKMIYFIKAKVSWDCELIGIIESGNL